MAQTKVRMAMVGGGEGAFIGAIHRIAARLDNQIELVAGCFSSKAERSAAMAAQLGISTARCYDSYQQLFAAEAQLPPEQRIEFVTIVTPNHLHFPVAKAALQAGFHVLSDKPATLSLAEAQQLQEIRQSRQQLENWLGKPVQHFAYPNGVKGTDFDDTTVKLVAEAGFSSAVITNWGICTAATPLHLLNRFTPWDKSPLKFHSRLTLNYTKPAHV